MREGRVAIAELSEVELLAAGVTRSSLQSAQYVRQAGVIEDVECFDAGFFGIGPRDAAIMDPQHRHFLECAWEALEDAAHVPSSFDGRVGVFAGCLLVFILALGYYITPALVGGQRDQMVSYFIAYYANQVTNWGMAAALSAILLAAVLVLYAVYNRLVGIDRLRMG